MVFLSLFLLVLAFFILLTALSEVNEESSLDIIQQVQESFSGEKTTNLPTTRQRLEADADAAAHQLAENLQALFDRDLPGVKTSVNDDRILQVRFPEFELFSRGRPTVRRTRLPLIRQVAGLMRTAPDGIEHRLEISIPDPGGSGSAVAGTAEQGDPARQLAISRLGHLAAAFTVDGASAAEMSIALRPRPADAAGGPEADAEVVMQVFTLLEEKKSYISFAPRSPSGASDAGPADGPVLNLRLDRTVPAAASGG